MAEVLPAAIRQNVEWRLPSMISYNWFASLFISLIDVLHLHLSILLASANPAQHLLFRDPCSECRQVMSAHPHVVTNLIAPT